jgi:hypothetical protein
MLPKLKLLQHLEVHLCHWKISYIQSSTIHKGPISNSIPCALGDSCYTNFLLLWDNAEENVTHGTHLYLHRCSAHSYYMHILMPRCGFSFLFQSVSENILSSSTPALFLLRK